MNCGFMKIFCLFFYWQPSITFCLPFPLLNTIFHFYRGDKPGRLSDLSVIDLLTPFQLHSPISF